MTERIKKLTELVMEGKMFPERTEVSYDRNDLFLKDDQRKSKRIYEYIQAQNPIINEFCAMTGNFEFDNTVTGTAGRLNGLNHLADLDREFYRDKIDNLSIFEGQHATADFNKVIHMGLKEMISEIEKSKVVHKGNEQAQDFLDALKVVAQAMIDWARKCSEMCREFASTVENEEYKNNILKLSNALKKVPENKAESFYEAVLSIFMLFSYAPDSVGTLDRTLNEYYENDLKNGVITRDEAKEYLQELFLLLQSKTPITSRYFTRGGESHFCIGGYLPNGEDCFSDLSMLILEALTDLPTYIPQVSLRWTKKLPFETFKKVMDLERKDPNKRIAFVNDDSKIAGFTHALGFNFEDACKYATVGCNECAFPGGMSATTTNENIMNCMQNTFFERTEDVLNAKTFEEFYEIYKQELYSDMSKMLEISDKFNLYRAKDTIYVTSLFFDGCIEKAMPYSKGTAKVTFGGPTVIGLANSIDSLSVVKQFVYDEKTVDMKTLTDALLNNWKGYEELQSLIKRKGKFFGNDDETSNYVANLFFDTIYEFLKDRKNAFGYPLMLGNLQGYRPHHEIFGRDTKASPDGRFDGENLKFGIGQSGGYDREGLTALLSSIAKCDRHHIMCGSSVTNIMVDRKMVENDDEFNKLCAVFDTYFKLGGSHFQLSCASADELIKAKENPEQHKSLRVRVSGFSDYFVKLPEVLQDEIIARTSHGL